MLKLLYFYLLDYKLKIYEGKECYWIVTPNNYSD